MTIYSLIVLLSQFWTNQFFHVLESCCFLNCIQVSQEAGKVVWYSLLFKNFAICWNPHKGFSIVLEAEVNIFLEFPCFPHDPTNIENLISDSSASSESCLCIWKFSVHMLLKPSLKDFDHTLATMWNEHNSIIFWTFFGIALWDWYENWPFPVLWPLLNFPNLLIYSVYKRVMDF